MALENSLLPRVFIALVVLAVFGIITFALAAATLGTLAKRFNEINSKLDASIVTSTVEPQVDSVLARSVRIGDLMEHLKQFENFAKASANTRAIGTAGFNMTLDYIEDYLKKNAYNLNVSREPFQVKNFSIKGAPAFYWIANETYTNLTYSTDLPKSDFTPVNYSVATNTTLAYTLFIVPNNGCNETDWIGVQKHAALVIAGGPCTYAEKGEFAMSKNATPLIFYNNGIRSNNLAPLIVRLRQKNTLPAVFLSYAMGKSLLYSMKQTNNSVTIHMQIELEDYGYFSVSNICADTTVGNPNETIIVGSHSDSVPAGPGINDNGSGSAANLVLATNLARLYATGNHMPYKYRVRFCWWGAEEIGLVGSIFHVDDATSRGDMNKYLVNLNFDMIGSPNYMFGIYDGKTANPQTRPHVVNGSIRISEAFRDWFNKRNLPFDYTDFSGRSDYGPFLKEGVVAGGLFSGADDTKSLAERNKYHLSLGANQGGLAGAIHDPCYHLPCDTIDNIDSFGYLTMVQAAADMIDYLGRKENLRSWLYYPS